MSLLNTSCTPLLSTGIGNSRVCKQISELIVNRNMEPNDIKWKTLSSLATDHLHLLYFVVQVPCLHRKKNKIDVKLLCKCLVSNKDESKNLKC